MSFTLALVIVAWIPWSDGLNLKFKHRLIHNHRHSHKHSHKHKTKTMHVLNSFADAEVPAGSLVVVDIDDTVLTLDKFPKGWFHRQVEESVAFGASFADARSLAIATWVKEAYDAAPAPIQQEAFRKFTQRVLEAGSHLIFLTARNKALRQLTEYHLEACGIEADASRMYFDENKGSALLDIVKERGFKRVVFIDDTEHNLQDVKAALDGVCELSLYHFQTP